MTPFASRRRLELLSWQGHERLVARLVYAHGWANVRRIGQSGDGGADVVADRSGRKWLFQVKKLQSRVGLETLQDTMAAVQRYEADLGVIVARGGFTNDAAQWARSMSPPLQLWDLARLRQLGEQVPNDPPILRRENWELRPYQVAAVQRIVEEWTANRHGRALVVLATGLGKTVVAAEAIRRIAQQAPQLRAVVLAHTKPLINQLDEALWPFLRADQASVVVSGEEPLSSDEMDEFQFVITTRDFLAARESTGSPSPHCDLVLVDECHHSQAATYAKVLEWLGTRGPSGPFLLGLTATPWRADKQALGPLFGNPITQIDLVRALRGGYLANLDYRLFVDHINWDKLRASRQEAVSIATINERIFSDHWSDAQVDRIHETWAEIKQSGEQPRGIVFCKTVEHAQRMAGRINALGFTRAEAVFASTGGAKMSAIERNVRLWDFHNGRVGILCSIDILNEGVDVPNVNLVAFARVTHSRQIFIQQLGRGLRVAPGKDKLIVLDFVTDVRRIKALLDLEHGLDGPELDGHDPPSIGSRHSVVFMRHDHRDDAAKAFLDLWLGDTAELEEAGEDASILRFPPSDMVPDGR